MKNKVPMSISMSLTKPEVSVVIPTMDKQWEVKKFNLDTMEEAHNLVDRLRSGFNEIIEKYTEVKDSMEKFY